MADMYQLHNQFTKPVYVVENHAHALAAWADIRRWCGIAPVVITLDHHTDTRGAFQAYAYKQCGESRRGECSRVTEQCLAELDFHSPESVALAISKLSNDEQIDTAIQAGVINAAFVISYRSSGTCSREISEFYDDYPVPGFTATRPQRPYTYDVPSNRIFEVDDGCAVGCVKTIHDDDCTRPHADQAIETCYLTEKLSIIHEMSQAIGIHDIWGHPYILDIDLDYFMTAKSIHPADPTLFYRLLESSIAVTIATEPSYVSLCRLRGEKITAKSLLRDLFDHITHALSIRNEVEDDCG